MTFTQADLGPEIPVLRKIERRVCHVNHDREMDARMAGKEAQFSVAGGCDSSGVPSSEESAKGNQKTDQGKQGRLPGDRAMIYPARCDCGWFGMSDDCRYNRCPNCGGRIERDRTEEEIRIRAAKRMAAKRAIERRPV